MRTHRLRFAVFLIATCFTLFLAKGNLEWIPNWTLLVVMGAAGVYWLANEPSVREVVAAIFRGEPGIIIHPDTYDSVRRRRVSNKAVSISVVVMGISLAIGTALWVYRSSNLPEIVVSKLDLGPIEANKQVALNLHFHNSGRTAIKYNLVQKSYHVDPLPDDWSRSIENYEDEWWDETLVQLKRNRQYLEAPAQTPLFQTLFSFTLTADEIEHIQSAKAAIYFMAIIVYNNASGSHEDDVCVYVCGDIRVLHMCYKHNSPVIGDGQ